MLRILSAAAAALCLATSVQAQAQTQTQTETQSSFIPTKLLLQDCSAPASSPGDAACTVFVLGMMNTLDIFVNAKMPIPAVGQIPAICLPFEFTPLEAIGIFMREARGNPSYADLPASVIIWLALAKQFPCN